MAKYGKVNMRQSSSPCSTGKGYEFEKGDKVSMELNGEIVIGIVTKPGRTSTVVDFESRKGYAWMNYCLKLVED